MEKHHRNGTVTYHHQMLGAALVCPGHKEVIPLMPEPILKQDGETKNDCERNALKRFLPKFRQDHPHLGSCTYNYPHLRVVATLDVGRAKSLENRKRDVQHAEKPRAPFPAQLSTHSQVSA